MCKTNFSLRLKDIISVKTSATSLFRSTKERFNIPKYHSFLFSAESGKSVTVAKQYVGGLFTNTTIPTLVDPGRPDGKVSVSAKKMEHMTKAYKFLNQNEEAQNLWKAILD